MIQWERTSCIPTYAMDMEINVPDIAYVASRRVQFKWQIYKRYRIA